MTTATPPDQAAPVTGEPRLPEGPRLRASDADRAAVIEILQEAIGRGLLTHDEGGERMAATFAARFRDELPALTADLPTTAAPGSAVAPGWRHIGSSIAVQLRSDVAAARTAGPRSRRFAISLLVALLVLGILLTLGAAAVHGLLGGGFEDHARSIRR